MARLHQTFWDNGNIKEEGTLSGDNRIGVWKSFTEDGFLREEITYSPVNDEHHVIYYFKNGNIQTEGFMDTNGFKGIRKSFYEDGSRFIESFMRNGVENGVYKKFEKHGGIEYMTEGQMQYGIPQGPWKLSIVNGKILQHEIWKDGVLVSTEVNPKAKSENDIFHAHLMEDAFGSTKRNDMTETYDNYDGDYDEAFKIVMFLIFFTFLILFISLLFK